MQETKPDHTSRWRECSRKFAHMVRDYIATTWRTLSPESRKKIKQAIAAFVISVVLALVVAGEGFSYAQYCTLFSALFRHPALDYRSGAAVCRRRFHRRLPRLCARQCGRH